MNSRRQITSHSFRRIRVSYERPLETGAIAYLNGNSDHTIAFRADIDALPILKKMMSIIEVKRIM